MATKKRLKNLKILTVVLFATLTVYQIAPSSAKTYSSVQVSPLIVEANLAAGEKKAFSIKYFNPVEEPQTVRPRIKDILPRDEFGRLRFLDYSSPKYSLSRWIDFDRTPFTLGPNEEKEIPYVINVPPDAHPGSHFGAIFGQVESENERAENSPFLVKQHVAAGTLVLINVPGEVLGEEKDWGGYLESFEVKTGGPLPLAKLPVKIVTRFKNTGIFCQTVWGGVNILDPFGNVVGKIHLPEKRVLPEASTHLTATWYRPLLLGRYTANLTLLYGKEGNFREQVQLSFWAVSKEVLATGGILIFGVIFLILKTRGKLKSRASA